MNKKRIITSALIGTIAVLGLSVSLTLAWYGASDRLHIKPFDVTVAGKANLLISDEKDGEYKSFINLSVEPEELEGKDVFTPVSSMFQSEWFDSEDAELRNTPCFYDSSSAAVFSNGEQRKARALTGFFQKAFYLKSNLNNYYVSLDVTKDHTEEGEPEDTDYCDFQIVGEKGNQTAGTGKRAYELSEDLKQNYDEKYWKSEDETYEMLSNLKKCIRLSILVLGDDDHPRHEYYIVDPMKEKDETTGKYIETDLGGRLDNNRDGYYDYYFDENDRVNKEIVYGQVNDRSKLIYDSTIVPLDESTQKPRFDNEDLPPHYLDSSFDALHRDICQEFLREETEDGVIEQENSLSFEEIADDRHNPLLIPCYANTPSKIVVSIYVEGWDKDCINATMGAYFKSILSFKLLRGITE